MNLLLLVVFVTIGVKAKEDPNVQFPNSVELHAVKIYKAMADYSVESFVISPLSSNLILSLLLNGARGQTLEQLLHALFLWNDLSVINHMVNSTVSKIKTNSAYTLKLLNKIYLNNDTNPKSDFLKIAYTLYSITVDLIDFKKQNESINQINSWAALNTENRVKNLVNTDDIQGDTRMVLLNALYFQATWVNKFNKKHTSKQLFTSSPTRNGLVDMMEQTAIFEYLYEYNAQFLKMPYVGSGIEMIVALPDYDYSLEELEDQLEDFLNLDNFMRRQVHVVLPKFKIDIKVNMKPLLKRLGIVDLFEPTAANLSGMSDQNLFVSDFIQKNHVEVNEDGAIGASGTAAMAGVGSSVKLKESIDFIADRPFIYFIRSICGVLFIGRYCGTKWNCENWSH